MQARLPEDIIFSQDHINLLRPPQKFLNSQELFFLYGHCFYKMVICMFFWHYLSHILCYLYHCSNYVTAFIAFQVSIYIYVLYVYVTENKGYFSSPEHKAVVVHCATTFLLEHLFWNRSMKFCLTYNNKNDTLMILYQNCSNPWSWLLK